MVMTDGVHGAVLGPIEMLVLNIVLITFCFFMLCRPTINSTREVLVLSTITIAAAASRIILEPLPNVQPLTVLCLIMGASVGARRGMAFAVMATMISNIILSHGLWTLFQATGWAAIAFAGSKLNLVIQSDILMKRLLVTSVIVSVLFDWWVSLSVITSGTTLFEFFLYILNGLPFDVLHALASIVSAVWIAPYLANLLHDEISDLEKPLISGEADVIAS
ncbi:MAG: hypothetical protein CMB55_05030 [Euryarchaeota archaeon]|nr:hypothetical protein [Euryarchaeota archaeon]